MAPTRSVGQPERLSVKAREAVVGTVDDGLVAASLSRCGGPVHEGQKQRVERLIDVAEEEHSNLSSRMRLIV